jgi:hypothetical protein
MSFDFTRALPFNTLLMADRWFSTPLQKWGSNGKRKRIIKLRGGRQNSREIELEIEE